MAKKPRVSESQLQEQLAREGLTVNSRWSNGPGAVYEAHEHPYRKVLLVASGSITFTLEADQRAVKLKPGDRLDLPPQTSHSALVGPEGVLCLEAHINQRVGDV